MSYHQPAPPGKDPQIWEIAKRRASFKTHLATYLVINAFFWILWFFGSDYDQRGIPWPVWPAAGWGVGLLFHYIGAYSTRGEDAVEKEYNNLINKK